jgi:uncharacterized protein (DUF1697 family)
MTKYAAFLRGIGPGNPNMAGGRLREVCEKLGLSNAQPIIASGNLVFETDRSDVQAIEQDLEAAWFDQLGFHSMTIVKTQQEIDELLAYDPFAGMTHGPRSYLLATFLKHPQKPRFDLPYQPEGKPYVITGYYKGTIFSVTDNTVLKTTDLMTWLEKEFGKDITSRTWNTVQRVNKKFILPT